MRNSIFSSYSARTVMQVLNGDPLPKKRAYAVDAVNAWVAKVGKDVAIETTERTLENTHRIWINQNIFQPVTAMVNYCLDWPNNSDDIFMSWEEVENHEPDEINGYPEILNWFLISKWMYEALQEEGSEIICSIEDGYIWAKTSGDSIYDLEIFKTISGDLETTIRGYKE